MMFLQCGKRSVNLEAIAMVNYSYTEAGETANVYFIGSDETLLLKDEEAATLSNALSALEARTERTLDREFLPSLFQTDADDLEALQASLAFNGPDCA